MGKTTLWKEHQLLKGQGAKVFRIGPTGMKGGSIRIYATLGLIAGFLLNAEADAIDILASDEGQMLYRRLLVAVQQGSRSGAETEIDRIYDFILSRGNATLALNWQAMALKLVRSLGQPARTSTCLP